ncbi:hypothetical protein OHB41_50800 [Streptomyces sp. NBC_01571]|uniref:hypothetical protein n=1 Tax=Streptomyces sp. NBC_01571 TaxID=2975883 RepID=UPI0022518AF1|nr:hypothetical protein [Streptomyces sp. NBC_01571]MCX4581249.1 hypothetical protein [Streptomyces sp. NBC_01571]
MADKDDPCDLLKGTPGYEFCRSDNQGGGHSGHGAGGSGLTGGAADNVKDLADGLIKKITSLIAPKNAWAPEKADNAVYAQFLWLGQHLTIAIFVCVVVVCALTAWQGAPRMRQMGASTGWALAAVAAMASVPGAVMLLNRAISEAFTAMFASNETTLFGAISEDMGKGADANPVGKLVMIAALVVALAFAALVFMARQIGILAFVCMAPLVLASLARGGDTSAVKAWATRLLGLMFAPFALLLLSPFVQMAKGSLAVDGVLLVAADALMLRMIFHGVPWFGPRVARGARSFVENRTDNRLAHAVVRAGAPAVYERENSPAHLRTIDTPGRAIHQDRGVLLGAYGVPQRTRESQLTTASTITQVRERAARTTALTAERKRIREAAAPPADNPPEPAASPPGPAVTIQRTAPAARRPGPRRTPNPPGSGQTPNP